jgi:hypothetical protein
MWYVGQKVICIDISFSPSKVHNPEVSSYDDAIALLKLNEVYTIAHVYYNEKFGASFDFIEVEHLPIRNQMGDFFVDLNGTILHHTYITSRFRPLVTTNIDVFRTMLTNIPKEELV